MSAVQFINTCTFDDGKKSRRGWGYLCPSKVFRWGVLGVWRVLSRVDIGSEALGAAWSWGLLVAPLRVFLEAFQGGAEAASHGPQR